MPPKSSNLHHITFHFYRSAVLLSLPANTTINNIKSTLLPALLPLSQTLPIQIPTSTSDIQLWETKPPVDGQEASPSDGIRNLEEDGGVGGKSISALGWGRWKTVFVSFRGEDGEFSEPIYTIPDVEDEEPNGSEA
ncbi:hypothetical protein CI109_104145 [Kwoniella shandongensis]|uniref:Uncharacterized protein n=1 Tax=Kwoniella shandongensis TaxID=1734106 RepID=A0A5M6C4R8_9TREE|nr:uncharacterized protein CI109_002942 [Kwoniella shandongensis]KAA5528782.1 hypothetical protein CI109_002942 [Kwoniella shandongensis]